MQAKNEMIIQSRISITEKFEYIKVLQHTTYGLRWIKMNLFLTV